MFRSIMNSNIGYYVYSAIVLIIGAGALVFFYFMVTGFNIGVYDENTIIGSVYVGGLSEEEAEEKVRTQLINWLENDDIKYEVGYQGYYYEFDRELLSFDISTTMNQTREGARNDLVVTFSETARVAVEDEILNQPFMQGLELQFDLDQVIDDVLSDAAALKSFSRKEFSNYIIDEAQLIETINDVTLPVLPNLDGEGLMMKLDDYLEDATLRIEPYTIHNLLNIFDDSFTSSELNMIGSLIQGVILDTTMVIQESHYNPQIDFNHYTVDTYPYFGYNVRINRHFNYNYIFENPHMIGYNIEFALSTDGTHMSARLIGPPYLDTIETEMSLNTIAHPVLTTTNPNQVREGIDAVHVSVERTVIDIFGETVTIGNRESVEVVFEFYPAIAAIVYETEEE